MRAGQLDEVKHEEVGVLCLDAEWLKGLRWEVLHVLGNDDLGVAADGGCQYVAVVRVGKREALDERLMSGDEAVGDRFAHQLSCRSSRFGRRSGRRSRTLRITSSRI
jgi:hypothetical protein